LEGRGCKKGELLASAGEEAAPFNLTGLFFDSFFADDSVSLCKVDCYCSESGTASDFDFEAGISAPGLDTESNGEEAAPSNLTGLFFDSFFAEDSVSLCRDYVSFWPRTFRDIPPLPLTRGEVFAFELEEVGKESSGPPGTWLRVWGPMSATLCQPGSSRPGGHNRHYPTPQRDKSWRPSNPRPPPVVERGCVRVPSPLDHARENTICQEARQGTLAASPEPLWRKGAQLLYTPVWFFVGKPVPEPC
jgi:hypothetical protein